MKREPKFKPTKGNKYRLILCDFSTIVSRDFKNRLDAPKILAKLQTDLVMKQMEDVEKIKWEKAEGEKGPLAELFKELLGES